MDCDMPGGSDGHRSLEELIEDFDLGVARVKTLSTDESERKRCALCGSVAVSPYGGGWNEPEDPDVVAWCDGCDTELTEDEILDPKGRGGRGGD